MEGSRSAGLIAATWASMVHLGRAGYLRYASEIFATAAKMLEAVRSHPELRVIGEPTFLFSFTSDEFDMYHVNDFMRGLGWRFNGQQYPNALHMAVTRPQTQPGVAEAFAADLDQAVVYAKDHAGEAPEVGAIYGGVIGGMTSRGGLVHKGGHGGHDGRPAGDPCLTRRAGSTWPYDHGVTIPAECEPPEDELIEFLTGLGATPDALAEAMKSGHLGGLAGDLVLAADRR